MAIVHICILAGATALADEIDFSKSRCVLFAGFTFTAAPGALSLVDIL
jgi:hypothetical protein